MITLNLLPPAQKEKIKKMAIYSVCENLVATVFITLSIVGAIFLISDNILQNNFAYFTDKGMDMPSQRQGLDKEIKKVNSELEIISAIQDDFIKWSDFLLVLNQTIPNRIRLNYLEIKPEDLSKGKKSLALNGLAATREDLLEFQKNLEELPMFLELKSPLSNILQQTNIKFTLKIQLDDLNK